LLCTEDDNSCYRNVCKMSVVSFALAVVFIISVRLIRAENKRTQLCLQTELAEENSQSLHSQKLPRWAQQIYVTKEKSRCS